MIFDFERDFSCCSCNLSCSFSSYSLAMVSTGYKFDDLDDDFSMVGNGSRKEIELGSDCLGDDTFDDTLDENELPLLYFINIYLSML